MKLATITVFLDEYITGSDVERHVTPFVDSIKDLPGVLQVGADLQSGPDVDNAALATYALGLIDQGVAEIPALEAAERVLGLDASGLIANSELSESLNALQAASDEQSEPLVEDEQPESDEDSQPESASLFDRFFSTPR